VASVTHDGANVIGVRGDVSIEADVVAMREAALAEFGAAHVVFNNAGVGGGMAIGTPKAVWDWVLDINLGGVINGVNAFVPLFLEQNEGHVVNTASESGLVGSAGSGPTVRANSPSSDCPRHSSKNWPERQGRPRHGALSQFRTHSYQRLSAQHAGELRGDPDDPMTKMVKKIADDLVNAGIEADEVAWPSRTRFSRTSSGFSPTSTPQPGSPSNRLEWMRGGRLHGPRSSRRPKVSDRYHSVVDLRASRATSPRYDRRSGRSSLPRSDAEAHRRRRTLDVAARVRNVGNEPGMLGEVFDEARAAWTRRPAPVGATLRAGRSTRN